MPTLKPTTRKVRMRTVLLTLGIGYVVIMALLFVAWYSNGLQQSFRWFNDWPEWLQMDKVGHLVVAYQISRAAMGLLGWAGADKPIVRWVGGSMGFFLFSPVELLDGFSPNYGASWPDLVFNLLGSGLAIANDYGFGSQVFHAKHSYWPSPYTTMRPDLLGTNYPQNFVKDYNGMKLWLSVNLHTLAPRSLKPYFPPYLNIAFGYGAQGLLGGYGKLPLWIIRQREFRQYYVGLDLDLDRMYVRHQWQRTALFMVNALRIPLPALRYSREGIAFTWFGF
jgi:hypothetical protein